MKLHPLFQNPKAIFVYQTPLLQTPSWGDFHMAAKQALKALQFQLEGEKVVFKPNVTSGEHFANPDTGIGTHPGFVHGLVEYLQDQGVSSRKITILEDPRDSDDNHPRHWRGTGYETLAEHTGVRLHCPTTYTCVKKVVPNPQVFPILNVSRLAVSPQTVLINVPKLKTHNLSITSLCMKNLMGLVNVFDRHYCAQAWQEMPIEIRDDKRPRQEWFEPWMHELWQAGLARRLIDTAQVLPPSLNIIEGVVGREGTGFQRGRNHPLGLVIAGINLVAVDSLASYLMGFDPHEIVYTRMAAEAGLGENDISRLQVYQAISGEPEQELRLVPYSEIQELRNQPPMCVIRNVKGEDPELFKNASLPSADFSGSQLTKTTFKFR